MFYIRELRNSTHLSQTQFAKTFNIPVSTLRKWEQNQSRPPEYLVSLIKKFLPQANSEYEEHLGNSGKKYYLDRKNNRVADRLGNWISFNEDISGVIKNNIGVYIETLFDSYYEAVENFDNELKVDKIHKIKWR